MELFNLNNYKAIAWTKNFGREFVEIDTLLDFENSIKSIEKDCAQLKLFERSRTVDLLFRGQSNSEWKLESTLERYLRDRGLSTVVSIDDYHRLSWQIRKKISSFYEKSWDIQEPESFSEQLKSGDAFAIEKAISSSLSYWTYLRHHGFPSPLLDWSRSPYIALFFAFVGASVKTKNVSIYIFCEQPQQMKLNSGIREVGQYIETHKRHWLQQSQYTYSVTSDRRKFGGYLIDEIAQKEFTPQDLIWEFRFSASMRNDVLNRLNKFNINSFSLFGNEEGLLASIAEDEFANALRMS